MESAVYILCAATSALCAALLGRAYWQKRMRLLLWSGLCFAGLMLSNILLVVDRLILPEQNLFVWRNGITLAGLLFLIYGLV